MTVAEATRRLPRVLLYGSLSKESKDREHVSIESQIANERERIEREHPDGFELLTDGAREFFADDGYSGSKRDRGPALERAIRAAVEAASDGSGAPVELWVNTPARLARGSGKKDEARSVLELFVHMQRQGVTLRSVNDDDLVRREELVGFASRMAAKYAEDLSESVKRARLRDFEKGEFTGGAPRDGYKIVRTHDDQGRVIGREIVIDEGPRADLWRSIFALDKEGISAGKIARRLNVEGERTKSGRYFDRRAITDGLDCEFYAGRLVRNVRSPDDVTVVKGKHPALIPPAEFDAQRRKRRALREAEAPAVKPRRQKGAGRPAQNHALAGLAHCGRCGETMSAVTSNYVRKDGTRRRIYQCRSGISGAGNCGAPCVSAELIDAEIIEELDKLLIDFDGWRERIEASQSDERERLTAELARAERDHAEQVRRHDAVSGKWADYIAAGDETKAALVLAQVEREADTLAQAERRLTATRDALDSIPEQADRDALLDFGNALKEAVRGRLDAAKGSMAAVNAALLELFESFELGETEWAGFVNGEPAFTSGRRAVMVQPILRESVALALADEWPKLIPTDDPDAPPLRWLTVPPAPEPEASDDTLSQIPTTPNRSSCRSPRTRAPPRAARGRWPLAASAGAAPPPSAAPARGPPPARPGRRWRDPRDGRDRAPHARRAAPARRAPQGPHGEAPSASMTAAAPAGRRACV
jgi:hypothetical protein